MRRPWREPLSQWQGLLGWGGLGKGGLGRGIGGGGSGRGSEKESLAIKPWVVRGVEEVFYWMEKGWMVVVWAHSWLPQERWVMAYVEKPLMRKVGRGVKRGRGRIDGLCCGVL